MSTTLKAVLGKYWVVPAMLLVVAAVTVYRAPSARAQADAPVAAPAPAKVESPAAPASVPAAKETDRYTLDEMDTKGSAAEVPSMGATLAKLVIIMVLLFALLLGGLVIFQRVSRRGIHFGGANRPLRMVDKLALTPKHSVCLIHTCGRYMVLGVAEKEINVLMEVTPTDEEEAKSFLGTLETAAQATKLRKAQ